jgi:phosphoribosyl-AMP cyclohydrolase
VRRVRGVTSSDPPNDRRRVATNALTQSPPPDYAEESCSLVSTTCTIIITRQLPDGWSCAHTRSFTTEPSDLQPATRRVFLCLDTVFSGRRRGAPAAKGFEMKIDFSKLDGLIPAIIQDVDTLEVLMVGFMNEEALEKTRQTGFATFWSRSRNKLWMKGETSGNQLKVVETLVDCDEDTLVLKCKPLGDGVACHTGERSCFYRKLEG